MTAERGECWGAYRRERQVIKHGVELEPQLFWHEARRLLDLGTQQLETAFFVFRDPAVHVAGFMIAAQHEPLGRILYLKQS